MNLKWVSASLTLLAAVIALAWFGGAARSASAPEWKTGFWFWDGSSNQIVASGGAVDVVYCKAGSIAREPSSHPGWRVYGNLPNELPAAREYWVVFRFEGEGVPAIETVPMLRSAVEQVLAQAQVRRIAVAGLQLDIDSSTNSLGEYTRYLREVRKALPSGTDLSITALLDWFRPGTEIAAVIREVNEFVPQFYDVRAARWGRNDYSVAKAIDAKRWGPVFNKFGKRFRVGVSSFGRARRVGESEGVLSDVAPLNFAMNTAFRHTSDTAAAGEVVLRYTAERRTFVGWTRFEPGEAIEFVLATPELIRASWQAARAMGGQCGGVVFFRWPTFHESLAVHPDQVMRAVGVRKGAPQPVRLQAVDRACAAVHCTDLYLFTAEPLSPEPTRHSIRSSAELEYFVAADRTPARMSGADRVELLLPPYCGRTRLYLGRAVTAAKSDFRLEGTR